MNYAISLARDYDANMEVLKALSGINVGVTIGVPNEAIAHVASSQEAADKCFETTFLMFTYVFGSDIFLLAITQFLVSFNPLYNQQLVFGNLYNSVRKTAVGDKVRGSSSPPSGGQFANGADKIMNNLTVICTV
ncbi:glucan endo-1,3-beta-glucosidase, basic vacuolar isoform-like [Populus nigra]|uniref:glucan endo-1,3-beta-glucosidase, basic vacuolar isoform-like n=1 Tax=Populus nigra TaxID=3691 RepID=UPI002B26889B|nr:glucan endo-1,3-beta-glucosidase, basic vacuolar isoform-like [Populus nigra]